MSDELGQLPIAALQWAVEAGPEEVEDLARILRNVNEGGPLERDAITGLRWFRPTNRRGRLESFGCCKGVLTGSRSPRGTVWLWATRPIIARAAAGARPTVR